MTLIKNLSLLLMFCSAVLVSCEDNEAVLPDLKITFEDYSEGLGERSVNDLLLSGNVLLASTDNGLFKRDISPGNTQPWEVLIAGQQVDDVVILEDNSLLAAVSDPQMEVFQLFRSEDQGATWIEIDHDFGGEHGERIYDLEYHAASQQLFGTGNLVVAKSPDGGATWTPVYGDWDFVATGLDFVKRNPKTNELWTGGQGALENFVLARFMPDGTELKEWGTLLPSPSVAKDIAFHPQAAGEVIIGAEEGIIQTKDNGDNWTTIRDDKETGRFFFGVDYDPGNTQRIYAAPWLKNGGLPQSLELYISQDSGSSWAVHKNTGPSVQYGGVLDMLFTTEGTRTILYLGLDGGGVFKVSIE